jgi:hypothetical protein
MAGSYQFAADVFRTVCDRLAAKAVDLRLLIESDTSFEPWLVWEAFLACKLRQESYPFCEVAAGPTYESEGVADNGGDSDRNRGDLRVGGPNDGADHCWLFAEIVLIRDSDHIGGAWVPKVEAAAGKLMRLGWKRSASLLLVVAASRGDVLTEWADALTGCAIWNQPALTDPFVVAMPGGSVVVKAIDIKRDPANTLKPAAAR